MRAGVIVCALLAVAGCLRDQLVECGDRLCPMGAVCSAQGCVHPDQLAACEGLDALATCSTAAIPSGACVDTVCQPLVCGDAITVVGLEACDDGNQRSGDGCSADCQSTEVCGNNYVDPLAGELCDSGIPGLSRDGCTSTCTPEISTWRDETPTQPVARVGHAMVAEPSRARLLMFGGSSANGVLDDTWELDNLAWRRTRPLVKPPGRTNHRMAHDIGRGRTVLFGGQGSQPLGDTWEWDGDDWMPRTFTTTSVPAPRSKHGMAFDAARGVIVLFGGMNQNALDDTWIYDGTSWTLQTPPTSPPAGECQLAYEPSSELVVYLGGSGATWTWDGATWKAQDPLPVLPHEGALASGPNGVYLVGAAGTTEVYRWTSAGWTSDADMAAVRNRAAVAYDAVQGLALFGGADTGTVARDDLFVRSDNGWSVLDEEVIDAWAITYQPLVGTSLLAGGSLNFRTLSWDGTLWSGEPITRDDPRERVLFTLTTLEDRVLLHGGASLGGVYRDTWTWGGSDGGRWRVVDDGTQMATRYAHSAAYDRARKVAIIHGGVTDTGTASDTWEWDGTSWREVVTPTTPPARMFAAMAYDPLRNRTIRFGGSDKANMHHADTWEYDGVDWRELSPPTSPSARMSAAMSYDPVRGTLVLYGGSGGAMTLNDTWEWDGTTWRLIETVSAPVPGAQPSLTYDARRGTLVMFDQRKRIWELTTFSFSRPPERCLDATADTDNDGFAGCDDPDCWGRCTPLCPPHTSCDPTTPQCGDGTCVPILEDARLCPSDCT